MYTLCIYSCVCYIEHVHSLYIQLCVCYIEHVCSLYSCVCYIEHVHVCCPHVEASNPIVYSVTYKTWGNSATVTDMELALCSSGVCHSANCVVHIIVCHWN